MQCMYCKSQDLEKISYDYYECKNCGKLNYEYKQGNEKSGPLGELYMIIGIISVIVVVTILILLFVTAASKRESLRSAAEKTAITTDKK